MHVGELKINRETMEQPHVEVLRMAGGIDAHTFDQLDATIQDIFDEGCHSIILDMSEVEYISSAGVGTLVSATHEAGAAGGNVVMIQLSERAMEVLKVLGLLNSLRVVADMKAALAFF